MRTPLGSPGTALVATLAPGTEEVGSGQIRVTILGSGDLFVRPSQASASVLVEVGNAAKDLFSTTRPSARPTKRCAPHATGPWRAPVIREGG